MESNKPLNLVDIARQAGVSRSTVSRVINGEQYVSERTREKVMAVVNKVGYTPNPIARMLVKQSTRVIGIVIPHTLEVVFQDPHYFPILLQGVSEVVMERDYATLLWWGAQDDETRFYDRVLKNRLMDGLVIASASVSDPLIPRLVEAGTPFAVVERPAEFQDRINYVSVDNIHAAKTAVDHLIQLGYRRIGTITGTLNNPDGQDRLLGYKQALEQAGMAVDDRLIVAGAFNRRSGYDGVQTLLQRDVDAVFAASDIMARGAMDAIHEAGLRVPDDVAVVGFDDLPSAVEGSPKLTTVRQPVREKGVWATNMLIDQIEDKLAEPRQIILPTELIVRESCGAKRRA